MKIIALQYDIAWEDKTANHAKVRSLLDAVPIGPNDLIVLPEMFDTGFSLNTNVTAEDTTGPSHTFLQDLALIRHSHILAGLTVKTPDNGLQNHALVFNPDGQMIIHYAKIHTFTPGGETGSLAPGHEVVTFALGEFSVAPFICYDLRFPEIFRLATRRGAQLLINIANWPAVRAAHWQSLLQARAIENQAYCLGLNRTGSDPNHSYLGQSTLFDPHGKTITTAQDSETVLTAELDIQPLLELRENFPAQADTRPHFITD